MPKYSVPGNKGTTSVKTVVAARADAITVGRGYLYDAVAGTVTTPADSVFEHEIVRVSTAGTGSSVTPSPNDPADAAAIFDATDTYTIDPTIGVVLFRMPINDRASFRWVRPPDGQLIWPATASNGLAWALASATTTDFSATLWVDSF